MTFISRRMNIIIIIIIESQPRLNTHSSFFNIFLLLFIVRFSSLFAFHDVFANHPKHT
jgi:hypothetical protein